MTKKGVQLAKRELARAYKVKDLGKPMFILDMAIYYDLHTQTISLSQRIYLTQVLEHFGMANCNPKHTPLSSDIILTSKMCLKDEADHIFMHDKPYH